MLSYKNFKKEYLNEWVDKSQAARKAAEELANKEVRPSLRDIYKNKFADSLIFDGDVNPIEFKDANETKADGGRYFTWDEAKKLYGEPDKDGWRLPTFYDLKNLVETEEFFFSEGFGYFEDRLALPADGVIRTPGVVQGKGKLGRYWTATVPVNPDTMPWTFSFHSAGCYMDLRSKKDMLSVRLIRDVK